MLFKKIPEELKNSPYYGEEKRKRFFRWLCLMLAAILVTGAVWWKWPVRVPAYEKGQTVQIVYTENYIADSGGFVTDSRFTEDENQIQQLFGLLNDNKFHRKIFQPFSGKSKWNSPLKEMMIIIRAQNQSQDLFLYINAEGSLKINGNDEYTVGLFNQVEQKFYDKLYAFYKDTFNNSVWQSRNQPNA